MATSTAPLPGPIVSDRFKDFTILETNYKQLNPTHSIPASILVPKTLKSTPGTKIPIAIFWHGGALVLGQRLYADWFCQWILEFVKSQNAILISPDYRLLPEHSGKDIIEDVRDFFTWLHDLKGLAAAVPDLELDTGNVLVTGGSAGGYLSVQSGLLDLPPEQRNAIKAVIAQYPMLDMRDRWYTQDYEKNLFSAGPNPPKHLLQDYLDELTGDEIVTSRIPPDGGMLSASIFGQGLYPKFLGTETGLYPFENLRRRAEKSERVPPTWVLHGREDDVVPVQGTEAFVELWKKVLPEKKGELYVNYESGSHGFDDAATVDTPWVAEGLRFVRSYWPEGGRA